MKYYRNVRLILAFDGTAYHGWQIQKNTLTVQKILGDALERVTEERVKLIGSGRTDAGTHARGLAANFISSNRIPPRNLVKALNSLLPRDIRVLSARRVPKEFHAQHAARSKIYRYQIYRGEVMPPHLAREHFHYQLPLDLEAMTHAAGLFAGKHDFASFAAKSNKVSRGNSRNTVRNIIRAELKRRGRRLLFTVEGDGFLHHMVRNMVGTLLQVGRGRISLDEFRALFVKRDRNLAGFTAPAHGLILLRVRY